ncbi:uncharacterized protein ATNIH1004_003599 [Aspergillus tanneri]|uniref:O-methyltransferase domain-containing protein n=1 Tax=Aspergillus tanneri TaxID=1220188 RepID=A0A5M9N1R6_9EURO|nr:uncharacterized protein ATNIH1004_003599 [Aspergillus tanneri]KAA8650909.1 hypothetical protein ATNIH1004_003599 [Aspergillus tanneri]
MAFKTDMPFYQYYQSADRERGMRFDSAMVRYFHSSAQLPIESVFNFDELRYNSIIVDVGGGRGHHSIRIFRQYPSKGEGSYYQDKKVNTPVV